MCANSGVNVAIQCFPIRVRSDSWPVCAYGFVEDTDEHGEQSGV